MTDAVKAQILDIESNLQVDHFTVSASFRNTGASYSRDTFLSMTFKKDGLSLKDTTSAILVAERKIGRLVLLDAVAKGIINEREQKEMLTAQEQNYEKLLDKLLSKPEGTDK